MDRNGRSKPPPGESGFFDLSKKSAADIAAEMAVRMARWRQAHKRPDVPARAPSAPAAAIRPQELDVATAARIHRALRPARVRHSYGAAFKTLLDEGPNRNAIGMRPERDAGEAPPPADISRFRAQVIGAAHAPALESGVQQAVRRARALAAAARDARIAGWQATMRPALVHGIDAAARGTRAIGAAARSLGSAASRTQRQLRVIAHAAWQELRPSLEDHIGAALRRVRALGAAARARGGAAWRSLAAALAPRIDAARLRLHALGVMARAHGRAAWQELALTLAPRIDRAKQRLHAAGAGARAFGFAAWQAPASRVVLAGVTVIAVAIAAWCLALPHAAVPPDIAGAPAIPVPREIAAAPTIDAPLPPPTTTPAPIQPPFAVTPLAPEAAEPEEVVGFLTPELKPPPPLPTLMAYLKPPTKTAAPARQEQPEPKLLEGRPLPPLPGAIPSPATPDELRQRDDPRGTDVMLDQMFSDRAGHKMRRKHRR